MKDNNKQSEVGQIDFKDLDALKRDVKRFARKMKEHIEYYCQGNSKVILLECLKQEWESKLKEAVKK